MSQERTYTIQIRMSADTAGGAEAAAVLEHLEQRSAQAGVSLKDFLNSVGQMPGDGTQALSEAGKGMNDVGDGADKMSKADAKNLILGLRTSIAGLASGNPEQALGGVASGLARVTSSLPSAAIAGAAAAATIAIVRVIANLVEASKADLNALGETVDEEMARLEAWAAQDFEFSGLVKSFDAVDNRMAQSQKAADTLKAALDAIFKSKEESQLSEMERQAKAAEDSGDKEGAEAKRQQIEQQKILNETISTLVAIETKRADDAAAKVGLQESAAALREIQEKSEATNQRLEEIRALLEERGLRGREQDPESNAFKSLFSKIYKQAESDPFKAYYASKYGTEGDMGFSLEEFQEEAKASRDLLGKLKEFINLSVVADKQTTETDKKQDEYDRAYSSTADSANQLNAEIAALETRLGALKSQLKDTDFATAQEKAFRQIEAIADALQRGVDDPGTDPEQIWANASDNIEAFKVVTASVPEAMANLKKIYDEWWTTAQSEADFQPLLDQARKLDEVIRILGTPADQQAIGSPEEVMASIRDNWQRLGQAVADGAQAASDTAEAAGQRIAESIGRVGAEVAKGGDKFVAVAAKIDSDASRGMSLMSQGANSMAAAVGHFSSTAESMLRQMASVAAMAAEAERKAALALQQISALR